MKPAVTLRHVADHIGLSKATVSMALRGDSRIAPETRKRVEDAARALGYRVDADMAKLMAKVKASKQETFRGTIALLNPDPNEKIFDFVTTYREWVEGVRERATKRGYTIDTFWLHEKGMNTARLAGILRSRSIEGVLVPATCGYNSLPPAFREIWENFACVVMGIRHTEPPMNFACNDQYATALEGVKQAVAHGYRRPGLALYKKVNDIVDQRFQGGFEMGCRVAGVYNDVPVLLYPDHDVGRAMTQAWLKKHKPDVVICIDHQIEPWIRAAGFRIPGDVGLIHLDHHVNLPDWAGMEQNNKLVGSAAVDLLVSQIYFDQKGPPETPASTLIASRWVPGPSVRQPGPTPQSN